MTSPSPARPRLIVVDAMSLIHRAFHAVPTTFSTSRGEPTNAVYGFVNMLFRVVDQVKPQFGVVAFDAPGGTFRDDVYEEYKADRESPPDELVVQFDRVRQVAAALGLPCFEIPGYEADDILGFMARRGTELGLDVMLITSDRDAYQLINDNVRVLTSNPRTGEPVIYDRDKVAERWSGLSPAQIVDLKALQGDSSDNIPGVPGIGEKTAVSLLDRYGTVENVLDHVAELPGRPRKALEPERNRELARLSKHLATIVTDLPIEFELEDARLWKADVGSVRELFLELEFRSLLNRLPFVASQADEDDKQLGLFGGGDVTAPETEAVADAAAARRLVAALEAAEAAAVFAVIEETIEGQVLLGVAFATAPDKSWYVNASAEDGNPAAEILGVMKPWFEDSQQRKVSHDVKQLIRAMRWIGIEAAGFDLDTSVATFLLTGGQRLETVDSIVLSRLQSELYAPESEWPRRRGLAGLDSDQIPGAAGARAIALVNLAPDIVEDLERSDLLDVFHDVEMALVPVLARIEDQGMQLDASLLKEMSGLLRGELDELRKEIYLDAGHEFNIDSPKQLGDVLFGELGLPAARKTKTGYSTAKNILDDLRDAHPIIDRVLEYRELAKLRSTYIDALPSLVNPRTGRIHTTLSQTVAATGRLSSRNPNLQNIPVRDERGRRIRNAFVAGSPDTILLSADYSQIELRVLAHISRDESMLRAFQNDEDIHAATAAQMFEVAPDEVTSSMRRVAKTTNFGIIYGITDVGLAMRTDLSRAESRGIIESYFEKYPAVRQYMDSTIAAAYRDGYVSTLLNRRRQMPELKARAYVKRQAGERMAINMPIQGTAAEIMKIAMIEMDRCLRDDGFRAVMILQVHDELLFELPRSERDRLGDAARDVMGNAFELDVPLKVDVSAGPDWGQMSPV